MLKYLRLLREFWVAAAAADVEYRANFLLASSAVAISFVGNIFTLWLFYHAGSGLGSWRWEESLLVMGLFTLLEGFSASLLSPNLSRIVTHVRLGTLDFVLLKPVDSQFWLSTRNLSVLGVPGMIAGLGIIGYAGWRLQLPPGAFVLALLPVALSLTMLYSLWFMLGATSVWFVKVYNVTEVLRSLLEAGRYPMEAYPASYRFFFTFVLPVAFLTTVPTQMILGRASGLSLVMASVLAVLLLLASRALWRYALRFYTSASS